MTLGDDTGYISSKKDKPIWRESLKGKGAMDATPRRKIEAATSWSVEYGGTAYDDARQIDDGWYFRDLLNGEFRRFQDQSAVVPLFENKKK